MTSVELVHASDWSWLVWWVVEQITWAVLRRLAAARSAAMTPVRRRPRRSLKPSFSSASASFTCDAVIESHNAPLHSLIIE